MEKEFIPYEQALALKELGFDEPCLRGWSDVKQIWYHPDSDIVLDNPTFSQCFRWFREKYGLHSFIESYNQDENGNDIEYIYSYCIVTNKILHKEMNIFYNSYEEAELECLKKLISIVKEQKL